MIGKPAGRLNFSPALACVDCQRATNQGLMHHISSLVWQLLPLCDEHGEEPSASDEPVSLRALRCCIHEQLAVVQHLQRRKHRITHVYVRPRRQHAHVKAQRALCRRLNRASRLETEVMEVGR
jgi:hypothetical protein